jgi:hypothetical protein
MREKTRKRKESPGPSPRGLDLFGSTGTGGGLATVAHGPYAEQLPVGEMTVGEIRARYGDRFDIDPESQAILDGIEVGDDVRIRSQQVLIFARRAGEKG